MAIKFDKKVKCNDEFVALRLLDDGTQIKLGNIYIPSTASINDRLGHYLVENAGKDAIEKYGINVGDYVMADRLSSFGHTEPVALMKYTNVICKTNKDRSEYKPLKDMVFVKPDKHEDSTNVNGIYISNYDKKLNVGTIVDANIVAEDVPFKINDRIMLVKGGDAIHSGSYDIIIYKIDQIICKIID